MAASAGVATREVLLVEDDPADALLLTEALRTTGIHATAVATLAGALTALREGFDCVLLDLNLPDSTGLETLRTVLRAEPETAVVVVTGLADHEFGEQAIADGAEDFVVKGSISAERLGQVVRYAVRRRRGALAAARRGRILELIARGASVDDTLAEVASIVEGYAGRPRLRCVVLRLDPQSGMLRPVRTTAPATLAMALGAIPASRAATCCAAAPCRSASPGPCPLDSAGPSPVVDAARGAGFATCWSVPLIGGTGQPVGALLVLTDGSGPLPSDEVEHIRSAAAHAALAIERDQVAGRVAQASMHDALTGLPNRVLLVERLHQALRRRSRQDAALGVIFVRIDAFTPADAPVADEVRDQVLTDVAARLRAVVRPGDTVARHGGSEFVVVVDSPSDPKDVDKVRDRLASTLSAAVPTTVGLTPLAVAFGVAVAGSGDLQPQALIDRASLAMTRARQEMTLPEPRSRR